MNKGKCIFCSNKLDDSDEHILPRVIGGKLHSKEIICSKCNNYLGSTIDFELKKIFNPILFALGYKNADGHYAKDPDGIDYLINKKGYVSLVKPAVLRRPDNKVAGVVFPNQNAKKLAKKLEAKLPENFKKLIKIEATVSQEPSPPLSYEFKFEINDGLILSLLKMAVEFYAYSAKQGHISDEIVTAIMTKDASKIRMKFLDANDIRKLDYDEISHLLILGVESKTGTLYAYIELFNLICCAIPLIKNYEQKDFHCQYYQDAYSGKVLDRDVQISIEPHHFDFDDYTHPDLGQFFGPTTHRIRERDFKNITLEVSTQINNEINEEIKAGKIPEEIGYVTKVKKVVEITTKIAFYNFPYIIDDFKDELDPRINYINSNMQAHEFDNFYERNKRLIGIEIRFSNGDSYLFDSFYKTPYGIIRGTKLITVFCVLISNKSGRKNYVPYYNFFEAARRHKNS